MQTVDQSSRSCRGMHTSSRSDPQPSCTEAPAGKELPRAANELVRKRCVHGRIFGPMPPSRSTLTRTIKRFSPGWRYGYLSTQRNRFASLSAWASAPVSVTVAVPEIRLRFVTVLNGDDDPRVAPAILRLLAPFRRVEQRLIALNVHPDHRQLRSPIRVERRGRTLFLQDFLYRLRQSDRHVAPPSSRSGCEDQEALTF